MSVAPARGFQLKRQDEPERQDSDRLIHCGSPIGYLRRESHLGATNLRSDVNLSRQCRPLPASPSMEELQHWVASRTEGG
jgi:hypothetical protein